MPGLDQVPYLTNSALMNLEVAPPHLLVVGGSYVGLEFGQMFRRFGSEVTVIEMGPRLIAREDEDVSTAIHEILTSEGINLRVNARCIRVSAEGQTVTVSTWTVRPANHPSSDRIFCWRWDGHPTPATSD